MCSRKLLEYRISNGKAGLVRIEILNLNSRERKNERKEKRRRAATPIANRPRGESVGSRSRDEDRRAKRVGQHLYPRRRE